MEGPPLLPDTARAGAGDGRRDHHWHVVAAKVGADLPGASPRQVAVSQRDVRGAELRFLSVAVPCRLAGVEDLPVLLADPVMDTLADPVWVITINIPGRVVAIDVAQDHRVVQRREVLQGEVVNPLVGRRGPDGWAVDVVYVEMLSGLVLGSWCAQHNSDGAPLGGVVFWLKGRLSDGLKVEAVPGEDRDISSPDRPHAPPAACPARDHRRLVSRNSQRAARQLGLLERHHIHLSIRQPAAEFADLARDTLRVPTGKQEAASFLAVVAVPPVLGAPAVAAPGHPRAAAPRTPAVGPHGGGVWSHLSRRAGPHRCRTARPDPRRCSRRR